jgi:hypothetical protein
MDHEFFKYIVIIIFILGALRSLFKKRPPQEPVKKPQSPEPWNDGREAAPVYKPPVEVNTDVDDYTIQREIEKMFGKVTPVSKPEPPVQEVQYSSPDTTAYSVIIPAGYQEEAKKETVSDITRILEKKTKADETARRFRESIKVKMQTPESLKDYIVISEILGKPKAFE